MADYFAALVEMAGLSKPQRRDAEERREEHSMRQAGRYERLGDMAMHKGSNLNAIYYYSDALRFEVRGDEREVIARKLKQVVKQLRAKPDKTETDRYILNEVGKTGELLLHRHGVSAESEPKAPAREHAMRAYPLPIAIVAAVSVGLGAMMGSVKTFTANASSSGDSSMILVAFLLLVLLYFFEMRPKNDKRK